MREPETPPDEAERLLALEGLSLLDTPAEERFDRITRIARRTFGVPIVLVSLVDRHRQWFKSCLGLEVSETPRAISFCGHAVANARPLVVPDALADERFADNPLVVGEPHVRFYAGVPIRGPQGHVLGTLCLIDRHPRTFGPDDLAVLTDLAAMVTHELANSELTRAVEAQLRAEHELRASQAFLGATLNSLQDHVAILDARGVVVAVNDTWRRYGDANGLTAPDHGIGMSYLDVCDRAAPFSAEAAAVATGLRELLAGRGGAVQLEYPCHGPDGMRWFVVSLSRFAGDGPPHVVVSHADITDRKRAEQALAESEGRFRTVFHQAPMGIAICTPDGLLIDTNAAYQAMLGYDAEALLGRHVHALSPEEDAVYHARFLRQARSGERDGYRLEQRYIRRDGSIVWGELNVTVRRSPEGHARYLIGMVQDVTARREAQTALAHEKAFIEEILDNIPVQVAMVSPDLHVRWANREACRVLGVPLEALTGRPVAALHPMSDEDVAALHQVLATGQPHVVSGVSVPTPAGPIACDTTLLRVPDGIVILSVDVSARAENERLQQQQIEALRQMDAIKDEFLGTVSHELRAPLHAVMGIANILANEVDGPLSDRQRADLGDLLASADDLAHLIDDLLALSQLRAGRFSLNPRPTNASAVAASVLSTMARLDATRDRTLVLDAPDELPVVADELRLAQVMRNLVHNAVKFTHPAGRVTLRLRDAEGSLRCEVVDDGIGIAEDDFGLLFERFTQLRAGKERGGTGLGLSICKGLVEAQGGAIGVESALGLGSTFWFTLPTAPAPVPSGH